MRIGCVWGEEGASLDKELIEEREWALEMPAERIEAEGSKLGRAWCDRGTADTVVGLRGHRGDLGLYSEGAGKALKRWHAISPGTKTGVG